MHEWWADELNLRLTARQEQFEDPGTKEQDKTSKRHQKGWCRKHPKDIIKNTK